MIEVKLKFLSYLCSSINVIIVCLQLIFLFFESGVIQLTLAHRLLKVETNAVWFPETKHLAAIGINGVNAANHVVFKTFSFKNMVDLHLKLTTRVWEVSKRTNKFFWLKGCTSTESLFFTIPNRIEFCKCWFLKKKEIKPIKRHGGYHLNCLLCKVLLNLHIFLVLNKTVPSRILSATKKAHNYIYTHKDHRSILLSVLKEFSSLEKYQYAEGFQRFHS